MDKKNNFYNNRANLQENESAYDCTNFECCPEELIFAMKDTSHEFSMGLSTVLHCLAIAEKEGYVPPIAHEWWADIRRY